ncbi:MAG: efflux RND transporter periplasmic adaptor subunit [Planctomycetota bacterium]|nr:efflux RND transporter periplasmic adaptor subunit [Planctomycetota bacterium]MDA1221057.1 efflux RND transporter periplasmic adaptor subunit [Planctomycetota bacterium]
MNLRSMMSGLRRTAVVVLVLASMTALVLWLSGVLTEKIPATDTPERIGIAVPDGSTFVAAAGVDAPVIEEAVGTIRAVQEIQVASRILARIRTMRVASAGQRVEAGEVLVELEDDDLRAALREAEAAHRSAGETRDQAERDVARTRELFEKQIASARELEQHETRLENAKADVDRAAQQVAAAETALGYAVIHSPIDGVVIDKLREKGDTVAPGQLLMTLYDPSRMQLVASVREQLATKLRVGAEVGVAVDALDLICSGEVSEIVPLAETGSRAFDVKVTGPCPDGVFSGMFGRLRVHLGTQREIQIPRSAVRSFGQVDQVLVVDGEGEGERLLRRFVVLGGDRDGARVRVLSGLREGERVLADATVLRGASNR